MEDISAGDFHWFQPAALTGIAVYAAYTSKMVVSESTKS